MNGMASQQPYYGHTQYQNFVSAPASGIQEVRNEQQDHGRLSHAYQQQEQNDVPGSFVHTSFAQPSTGQDFDQQLA